MRSIERAGPTGWAVLSQQARVGITSSSATCYPDATSIQAPCPCHALAPNPLALFATFTFLVHVYKGVGVCLDAHVCAGIHMHYGMRGEASGHHSCHSSATVYLGFGDRVSH